MATPTGRGAGAAAILFVEDDVACRELGAYVLRSAGHLVDCARDGLVALDAFSPHRHRLIITDLRMPRMSGRELIQRIRRTTPDIPVIVVTASAADDVLGHADFAGILGFLHKPYSARRLLELVKEVGRDDEDR